MIISQILFLHFTNSRCCHHRRRRLPSYICDAKNACWRSKMRWREEKNEIISFSVRQEQNSWKAITRFWLFAIFFSYISSIILDRVLIILVIYASVSIKSVSEWENNLSENNLHNNNRSCYFENLIRCVCRLCVCHSLEMMWLQF